MISLEISDENHEQKFLKCKDSKIYSPMIRQISTKSKNMSIDNSESNLFNIERSQLNGSSLL